MESVPEDVVVEILVRVTGILDLFRCAATCTRWRLLIADHSFLRRRWTKGAHHRSSLLGFFSAQRPAQEQTVLGIIPPFTLAPWSPFSLRFPIIPVPGGCQASLYTTRQGLIVACFIPYRSTGHGKIVKLAVCDPVDGKSRVLAPLKADGQLFRILGCTVLTRADCCSNERRWPSVCYRPDFFKVLIVSYADERYNLHVFTSGDSSWGTPIKFFDPLEHGEFIESLQIGAAVCQGTAHWLYKDSSSHYTLDVSTDETAHIFLTKLPIAPDQPGFDFYSAPVLSVTGEGVLSLLRLYRKCTGLEIWTRQGGDTNGDGICWNLSKMIRLQRPERSKIDMVECVCVGERSGVLLIKDIKNCMYIADLEAGTMENVTNLFDGVVAAAIPFEMDWPIFFRSRLAGGAIKQPKLGGPIQKVANSFWGRIFGRLSLG